MRTRRRRSSFGPERRPASLGSTAEVFPEEMNQDDYSRPTWRSRSRSMSDVSPVRRPTGRSRSVSDVSPVRRPTGRSRSRNISDVSPVHPLRAPWVRRPPGRTRSVSEMGRSRPNLRTGRSDRRDSRYLEFKAFPGCPKKGSRKGVDDGIKEDAKSHEEAHAIRFCGMLDALMLAKSHEEAHAIRFCGMLEALMLDNKHASNLADCYRGNDEDIEDESLTPHDIPLQELKKVTDNFSDDRILGQGGFGVVYKGVFPNGKKIAVKKIVSSLMPGMQKQFESEVCNLMSLKHLNVVQFVGYCYETKYACLEYNGKHVFAEMAEKLLCFEYLPKGSWDKYLSDESSGLDWNTRYKIIEGICYGLCYLHEQIDKPIIHLDLKPANILLTGSLVPKITDFGLSRLLGQEQTICTSSRIGTFGYMAPEFLHGGTITPKLDIFSLGVIIMEVVTGHRDYPDVTRTPSDDFIELALEKWRNVLQRSLGYGSLETDCEQIKRCLQVGLICVDPDRNKRPRIKRVIGMLQGLESVISEATT